MLYQPVKPPRSRARRNAFDSLSERAYHQIRDKILRGEYRLGAALSRRKLAKEFGMSFLPVSEALQTLERDGLVESKPRVGTRVRAPSIQDTRERYVMREALETQAGRIFAERADPSGKRELLRMGRHLDQLHGCCAGADNAFLFSVHTYHMGFHLRIAEASGHQLLCDAIEREQALVFKWLFDATAERRALPPHFHSDLASALASGDVDRADKEMRRHVRFGMKEVLDAIEPEDAEGEWRISGGRAKRPQTPARKR